jgi:hypothetical protein
MTARTTLTVLGAVLSAATVAAPAADYGIYFQYRSHSPRYYSGFFTGCETACAPRSYFCYDYDAYVLDGDWLPYGGPVAYVGCATPSVVVHDSCYPTVYHRTYTRSAYFTRPPRHYSARFYYGGGYRFPPYSGCAAVGRGYYPFPRPSIGPYRYDRGACHQRDDARSWYRGLSYASRSSYGGAVLRLGDRDRSSRSVFQSGRRGAALRLTDNDRSRGPNFRPSSAHEHRRGVQYHGSGRASRGRNSWGHRGNSPVRIRIGR